MRRVIGWVIVIASVGLASWLIDVVLGVAGHGGRYQSAFISLQRTHQPTEGADGFPILARAAREASLVGKLVNPTSDDALWPNFSSLVMRPGEHMSLELSHEERLRAIMALDLANQRGLWRMLDEVASSGRFHPPAPRGRATESPVGHVGLTRILVRMTWGRMRLAAERGDLAERLRAFEHGLALSRACFAGVQLLSHGTGYAVLNGTQQRFAEDVQAFPLPLAYGASCFTASGQISPMTAGRLT